MAEKPKKKVVRVETEVSKPKNQSNTSGGKSGAKSAGTPAAKTGTKNTDSAKEPVWTPTPEAKSKATRFRVFAWIAWVVAIGLEIFTIAWVLKQTPVNTWLLVGILVVIALLAVAGNLLWKQANRLDPASERNKTKFFIQNQLGAIMTILAFLPLIVLIFTNKDMDGKQKAVAGGIGAVLAIAVALLSGVTWDSPSQEQYAAEENIIVALTGADEVYWVKSGTVFHVCEAVPDVNRESKDGQIYVGTVAEAHAQGKERLTQKWQSEALNYCGYTQEDVDRVLGAVETSDSDLHGDEQSE
ncbi:hypothetical protein U6G28_08525 [Actinomycetaceae bacterium MB13-C1-2]|nr:hypothetical protein U6G28_08525 [Actinomycetaceae bacterium MB13-C1-2]